MTADDHHVSLREITANTVRAICDLSVDATQISFVASNALSIAEAHFCPEAWFRAIYVGGTPVGFVMLDVQPDKPEYFLWRFMIDARHQGRGYGCRALELIADHVRGLPNATELLTSVVEGEGGPRPFYERLGFVPTGTFEEGEAVLRLQL